MNAKDKIEELALQVAIEALRPDTSPEDRREALKILNPHYTMLLKSKVKPEEPSEGFDFDAFNLETQNVNAGTEMGGYSGGHSVTRGGRTLPS